jgi:hypothetical protein
MIRGLLYLALLFLISTFPATWLLMLFIGNLSPDAGLSYWGALPLGILASALIAGSGSSTVYRPVVV